MKGGAAIAKILKQEGVRYLFCFPNNAIIDATSEVGIRPIITRVERTAVAMAVGYARTNGGDPQAVCVFQGGPGIEHAYGGIAHAFSDSSPILILPGQAGQARQNMSTNFDAVRNFEGITKWAAQINSAERVPDMMRRGISALRTGRPGPVLLEVGTDVVNAAMTDEEFEYQEVKRRRSAGDPEDIKEVATVLLNADLPVIYAGQGIFFAEAYKELQELAELINAPVMTTTLGKSCFPEDHPLSLGAGGNSAPKMVPDFLAKCDTVFGIGTSFQKTLASYAVPKGKTIIQSTIDGADLDNEYAIDHAIVGDAKLVLQGLIDEIKSRNPKGRDGNGIIEDVKASKDAWMEEWMPHLTSNDTPINPYRVIWELRNNVDRANTIVTHDSGNPRDQMVPFFETIAPKTYMGWGNSTPLGTGLGLALGAKMAAPDKLCVNLMGDTAAGTALMDIETAVREKIPILTVIMNNSAMGGYEHNIPLSVEKYGTKYLSGDYSGVAAALGAYTETITDPNEIAPAIKRAIAKIEGGQTAVLEIITKEFPVFSGK
ncbi:MAG: thiamine pyrophosphate-requiring protein [SAR202 cluster bacterium]|nr:thiamine pyrophosphate-requiring protein [SAR202 cluster bacterium]|tara:strand:- start:996 stop:2627 length:1632 start_codon:yes stop_codon:yes gene_type:complete